MSITNNENGDKIWPIPGVLDNDPKSSFGNGSKAIPTNPVPISALNPTPKIVDFIYSTDYKLKKVVLSLSSYHEKRHYRRNK